MGGGEGGGGGRVGAWEGGREGMSVLCSHTPYLPYCLLSPTLQSGANSKNACIFPLPEDGLRGKVTAIVCFGMAWVGGVYMCAGGPALTPGDLAENACILA